MAPLSEYKKTRAVALVLSGCSVRGVARYFGTTEATVRKHVAAVSFPTEADKAAFLDEYLRVDTKAILDKRSADGAAGKLGGKTNAAHRRDADDLDRRTNFGKNAPLGAWKRSTRT